MAEKGLGDRPLALQKLVGAARTVRGKLITGSLIHGHHIVMKTVPSKLWDLRRPFIQRAQDILEKYDVKLLDTMDELEKASTDEIHNLCYAINGYKGIHSLAYTKAVAKKLEQAVKDATRRGGKVDYDMARENVIAALGKMLTLTHFKP